MNIYTPDKWLILKIDGEDHSHYRVFGSWSGGYLEGDSWRMNSGIENIIDADTHWEFIGNSGSTYKCHKEMYGSNSYGMSVVNGYIKQYPDRIHVIAEEDFQTELKELFT